MRAPDFSTRSTGKRRSGFADLVALGVALALFLAAGISAWRARAALSAERLEVHSLRRQIVGSERDLRQLRAGQGPRGDQLVRQIVDTHAAPPHRVVADMAALMPDDVRLAALSLGYGSHLEIVADFRARRPEAYDMLLERLADATTFVEIAPGAERREGELRATVKMRYEAGGAR